MLPFADLRAALVSLLVSRLLMAGIAYVLGRALEGESIDAAIMSARDDIDRAQQVGGRVGVPGHVPFPGSGFEGRDNVIGDLAVNIEVSIGGSFGHGLSFQASEA